MFVSDRRNYQKKIQSYGLEKQGKREVKTGLVQESCF